MFERTRLPMPSKWNFRCLGALFAAVSVTFLPVASADDVAGGDSGAGSSDGTSLFPEGSATPRYTSAAEEAYLADNPPGSLRGSTPPPTGQIYCPPEYAPMDGILIAWEGPAAWKDILAQMAAQITTTGDADIHVMVDSGTESTAALSEMSAAGTDMGRVTPYVEPTDSIWIRDYGPRYIYEGGCRAIVDHTYNQLARVLDNAQPAFFAGATGHAYYEIPLVHGGGNYHLNALSESNTTRLIVNENPSLSESEIHDLWMQYQNLDTTFWDPFPQIVDATQHIDMWMQVIADDEIIISDWPFNVGTTQDNICDDAAATFTANGWTVHRVPARSVGGVHYTYTNVVMCNDLVLVPTYTNSQVTQHNSPALNTWQAALPSHRIEPIGCENIVSAAGVMHCIVMHLPAYLNGSNPTVFLKNLRGGETVDTDSPVEIRWISDDDVATDNVDILLSTNGGQSFDTTVVAQTPDDGSFIWATPDTYVESAKIKLIIRDGDGLEDEDESDTPFAIGTLPGDADGDGDVDGNDYRSFTLCLDKSGPGVLPDPDPPINQQQCLDVFDADNDDDVDLGDFGQFTGFFAG